MGNVEKGRVLFRSVPGAAMWKRSANVKIGPNLHGLCERRRSGRWILLHRSQHEQRYHLGRVPERACGECQKSTSREQSDAMEK